MTFLRSANKIVVLKIHANTRQVKNFIPSHGTWAKTDSLDAKALAQYGSERCGHLQLFTHILKEQTALFALYQRRDDITKMLLQEKNRVKTPGNVTLRKVVNKLLNSSTIR